MSWVLTDAEIKGVLAAPQSKQYEYFIKKVTDQDQVWALKYSGRLATIDENQRVVPFWPHRRYVELCMNLFPANSNPTRMSLRQFCYDCLPRLAGALRRAAVFPTPSRAGMEVDPTSLCEAILRYKADWYGD